MSLEISSWTFSFQKTAFIDSNPIKLLLLEKDNMAFKTVPGHPEADEAATFSTSTAKRGGKIEELRALRLGLS